MINFIYGILISGSLIIAIGAQNTHVIKHGVSACNVFFVALTCFLCDVILMTCGIFFIGSISHLNRWVNITICVLSITFLLLYAFFSFRDALKNHRSSSLSIPVHKTQETILKSIISSLAITLLNPHVYLDTVVIIGGYASSLTYHDKFFFLAGALLASFAWFFSLGYFSKYLSKFFNSHRTWVFFDIFVGLFMLVLVANLMIYLFSELL